MSLPRALCAALLFALVAACPRQTEVKPTPQEEPPPPEPAPKPKPPPQKPKPPPPKVAQPAPEPPPVVIIEDGTRLEYRPHAGRTVVEVTEPEGAQVQAFDGSALVADDTVPLAFDAQPDHYYRLVARFPSGAVRDKKVQAKAGRLLSVRLQEAKEPQAMTDKDFRALRTELEHEHGDTAKLSILRTAAASGYFTTAQAASLIDRLVYREDKLAAIPILKDRILDRENAWQLYQHFTYREDKMKVQEMLER
jgi:glucose/arabinose dehydrogenase